VVVLFEWEPLQCAAKAASDICSANVVSASCEKPARNTPDARVYSSMCVVRLAKFLVDAIKHRLNPFAKSFVAIKK
jgi:hypothetical protein